MFQNDVTFAHIIFFFFFIELRRHLAAVAEMATTSASFASFSVILRPSSSNPQFFLFNVAPRTGTSHSRTRSTRFRCSAGQTGFFTKLGRLIKEKAKSDVEKLFSGFSKTRSNLAVIDELLLYWNLADTDRVLDELEEVPSYSFLNSWVFYFI